MILIVSFPAISKSVIKFESLIKGPDPEMKIKLEQLSELRLALVKYMENSLDHASDLLTSIDNYVRMLIETVCPRHHSYRCLP